MTELFDGTESGCMSLIGLSTASERENSTAQCPRRVIRILCAARGSCTIAVGDETFPLIGERMLLFMGPLSYAIMAPSEDCMITRIEVNVTTLREGGYPVRQLMECYPEVDALLRRDMPYLSFEDSYAMMPPTLRLLQTFSLYDSPEREIQLSITLSYLLAMISSCAVENSQLSKRYHRHVSEALKYIHENYMCCITVTDIAAKVGVHASHLHRLFSAEVGMNVGEYIVNLRVRKASSLLIRTDMPISLIAVRVGATTLQYFCRMFKQRVGMTPNEFRKNYNITCKYTPERSSYVVMGNSCAMSQAFTGGEV
ncbi:MAG: helix-turn-helix domain-containing protein [Clostridia bacterium]